jgi:hypothetical protein
LPHDENSLNQAAAAAAAAAAQQEELGFLEKVEKSRHESRSPNDRLF